MKVAVLGAGISGVTTAYYLAGFGHDVVVYDRAAESAAETSFANGGVIGGTQIEPWAQPGLPTKILGWIGREHAPIVVRPAQLPSMIGWGLRFLSRCTPAAYRQSLLNHLRLTLHSLAAFAELRDDGAVDGSDYGLGTRGAIKLYFSGESYDHARREASELRRHGLEVSELSASAAARLEPGLTQSAPTIAGGLLFPGDEMGDCRRFVQALERKCRTLGVEFRYGVEVAKLVGDDAGASLTHAASSEGDIVADAFVLALASHSPRLLRTVGLHVPIIPTKGVTITVTAAPWDYAVRGAVMDHSRLFGLIRIGDELRVSGSAEIAGYDATLSRRRCDAVVANVLELFPDFQRCLDAAEPKYWAGLRGNTPDGAPVLGKTPIANLFLNCGHGPQGWSTSAGSAQLVAQIVSGVTPAIDLAGLTMDRF